MYIFNSGYASSSQNYTFWLDDTRGYGTHVVGVISGLEYGVAPRANLISVKVHSKSASTGAIERRPSCTFLLGLRL